MQSQTISLSFSKPMVLGLYAVSFLVPFFLGGPQLIVGTLVNAFLIGAGLSQRENKELLPLLVLPSLGTFSRGIVFGPLTPLLLYMLPVIWLGNGLLVFTIRYARNNENFSYFSALFLGSLAKALILYASAFAFVGVNILPDSFLPSMGMIQLLTASLGGVCVYLVLKIVGEK